MGERWELTRISLRPWPGATPLQPVITALFRVVEAGRIDRDHTRTIRIRVAPAVKEQHARFRHPNGTFEAMLSVDYAAATLVRHGRLGIDEFMPAVYGRPELHDLIDRVVVVEADPGLTPLACRVEVTDDAGGVETMAVERPWGHPDDPASRALWADKFRRFATGGLKPSTADDILRQLADLEHVADAGPLIQLIQPGLG